MTGLNSQRNHKTTARVAGERQPVCKQSRSHAESDSVCVVHRPLHMFAKKYSGCAVVSNQFPLM